MRRFTEPKLVIATHNAGKLREIAALIRPFGVEAVSAGELGLPEPEETGDTYEANAELKARAAAEGSGLPALADDSGVAVDALDGRPGIYTARWAGPTKDFRIAMRKVEDELAGHTDRRAHFICVLALAWPQAAGGRLELFRGEVDGDLVWPPRGERGFGFDPVFRPDGRQITFGEMDPVAKDRISHRAVAFDKLVNAWFR